MKNKPNIVYLLADQIRACSLPVYGDTQIETPHIDRLAQEGTVFLKRNRHRARLHSVPLHATHRTASADDRAPHQLRQNPTR